MPRTARASQADHCYHVLNRVNARAQVFHKPADYASSVELIEAACRRRPMRVLVYCPMPNHFHLVPWPVGDGDLGTSMQWLTTSHVRRHHRHYHSSRSGRGPCVVELASPLGRRPDPARPRAAPRGEGWVEEVYQVADDGEFARVRRSVDRGAPFGSDARAARAADRLGP